MHRWWSVMSLLAGLAGAAGGVRAEAMVQQPRDSLAVYRLGGIVVEGRVDDLIGVARTASQGFVGARDLRLRPLAREGELLETVPGLIATQHSGDGKANQIFVRGFNLDHGTDFSTRVEGMPVNVVSHAHGQGYTDLNFLVPELVDHVEYRLGPQHAEIGDFGAAGGVEFRLRRTLDRPFVTLGLGAHGFARFAAGASAPVAGGSLLAAGEVKGYDGPWRRPQELRKASGMLRWSRSAGAGSLSVLALGYDNRWNASDQIPRRLVAQGVLDRFAQIDSTLGGASYRYSLSAEWARTAERTRQRVQVYASHSDLDLFSNFTYRLEDPANGDQIRQRDRGRWTLGASAMHAQPVAARHELTFGMQARHDDARVALYRTRARAPISTVRTDEVRQWNIGVYAELESAWTPRLRSVIGVRGDRFGFAVAADRPENSGTAGDGILSPSLSLAWQPLDAAELYASAGLGFHSNDARGTVQRVDPVTGAAVEPVDPLVASRGAELGLRSSPRSDLRSTVAVWAVELDSELLFVGDAGTTEPGGASRRIGITFANFWRVVGHLATDLDLSLTRARFQDAAPDEDRVPGALENVIAAGLSWDPPTDGVQGSIRFRRLGAHPLLEDGSARGAAATVVNLSVGGQRGPVRLVLELFNLFDSTDADIQYFYASRVGAEPVGGVPDLHFHPIEPRHLRVRLSWGL